MEIDDLFVQLVEALDRDLELMTVLRYRLVVLGALAGADQSPSIPQGVKELERASEALRLADLVRASVTEHLADELELETMPRLDELAARASGGWGEILLDQRRKVLETVMAIKALAENVSAAMGARAALANKALAFFQSDGAQTYGRVAPRGSVLVDGSI